MKFHNLQVKFLLLIFFLRNNEITLTRNEMLELQMIYRNLVRLVTAKKIETKSKGCSRLF